MKQTIKNYSFNASSHTITFSDFSSIVLERVYLITNVTSNTLIYQFNNNALGGTASTNVLTLTFNTGSMSNTDKLQIIYDATVGDPDYDNVVSIQGVGGGTAVPVSGTITTTPSGTQTVSGTVTANAGTNLNTSALALESGGNLATITTNTGKIPAQGQALSSASLPVVLPAAQITTLTPPTTITANAGMGTFTVGQGTGTNLHTVVDSGSITVSGTVTTTPPSNASTNLAQIAGSTVSTAASGVILIGNADGSGNKLTTNSTTTASKFALDQNVISILGTAPTTAGFLDVKGADGNVFVRQTTAANLNATVVGTGTFAVQAGSSTATGSAVPANAFYHGINARTSLPTAASSGNLTGAMGDKFGRTVVIPQGMRDIISPITQNTLTATTTETALITAVASTLIDILSIIVMNTSLTACQVDFRDSTGGTIRFSLFVPGNDTRGIVFNVPMPQNTANNNWTVKCGTSVSSIIVSGSYIANQ